MSTNDTVIAFSNGAAVDPGAEEIDEDKHPEDLETNYSLSTSRNLLFMMTKARRSSLLSL